MPAFKPPESRNAADDADVVAVLLAVLFLGITFVAVVVRRRSRPTRASPEDRHQPGRRRDSTARDRSLFYLFQTFTALILFLAANTSLQRLPAPRRDPRPTDGYMPRQFSFRGDRLAFTSGVLILSVVAIALLLALRRRDTHALIPLYSVGVFIAFTVGQSRDDPALAARAAAGLAVAARDQRVRAAR